MAITKKGNTWELNNSLWIICSFIFIVNGSGLIIAGNRTCVKKWRYIGLFYLVATWIAMYGVAESTEFLSGITSLISFILLYVVCIIHSFAIRKKYLIKLELIGNQKADLYMANELKNQAAREYGICYNTVKVDCVATQENSVPTSTNKIINDLDKNMQLSNNGNNMEQVYDTNQETVDYTNNMNQTAQTLLDINTCSQEDLLQLPGIGIIEAKKVIDFRKSNEFKSVEEYIEYLNIKPHFAEKIKPMLICNKVQKGTNNVGKNINQEYNDTDHMGRMVDF